MSTWSFVFCGTSILFSIVVAPIYILTNSVRGFSCFSFSILKMFLYCHLASTVSDNLLSFLFLFFCSVSCFPLVAFKIFSFSSGSQQFIMMCLGVLFLCLFCLESVAFLGSVLCRLLSTWKISNHCIFKYFFCPRTLLLSWRYHLVLSHGSLMFVHFFPLCILFWVVSIVLSSQLLIFLLENLISC